MKKDLLKGLTDEQIKKVAACRSSEKLFKLIKEEGIELDREQLEAVSGGSCTFVKVCPYCGSDRITVLSGSISSITYRCYNCKRDFDV